LGGGARAPPGRPREMNLHSPSGEHPAGLAESLEMRGIRNRGRTTAGPNRVPVAPRAMGTRLALLRWQQPRRDWCSSINSRASARWGRASSSQESGCEPPRCCSAERLVPDCQVVLAEPGFLRPRQIWLRSAIPGGRPRSCRHRRGRPAELRGVVSRSPRTATRARRCMGGHAGGTDGGGQRGSSVRQRALR